MITEKATYKEIRREFSKIKWKEVFQSKNVSEMWRILVEEYDRIVKLYNRDGRKRKPL